MSIFSYLFQPDKSKLSPIGRAFIAWLEIVIITVITTGAGAGLDYLNGHPEDIRGIFPYVAYAIVIALLKALTTLGVSLKNTSIIEPVVSAPASQAAPVPVPIYVNVPSMPPITPAPLPPPPSVTASWEASWAAPVMQQQQQFKSPVPPVPNVAESVTGSLPVVSDDRGWTQLEVPVVWGPTGQS